MTLAERLANLERLKRQEGVLKTPENTLETWEKIGNHDWESAGFQSKEEMDKWISENEYSNIA